MTKHQPVNPHDSLQENSVNNSFGFASQHASFSDYCVQLDLEYLQNRLDSAAAAATAAVAAASAAFRQIRCPARAAALFINGMERFMPPARSKHSDGRTPCMAVSILDEIKPLTYI